MQQILLLLLIIYVAYLPAATAQSFTNWESVPQEEETRLLKDTLRQINEVATEDYNIYRPYLLDTNEQGDIAFIDIDSYHIISTSISSLSDIRSYGGGKGRGPKEFTGAFDLSMYPNDDVIVADKEQHKVSIWKSSGELIKEVKLPRGLIASRLTTCDDRSFYLISRLYKEDGIIRAFNASAEPEFSFQTLEEGDARSVFVYDGSLDCTNGALYYAGRYKEFIRKYDSTGELIYSRSVVDFEPNDKIIDVQQTGRRK